MADPDLSSDVHAAQSSATAFPVVADQPPAGAPVQVGVITGFGINTDREMGDAFAYVGAAARRLHINDLIARPELLAELAILVFPGGFSFGDHIGSGAMLARLALRGLRDPLRRFIDEGGLVLGICNGFQVLVRMGLLPATGGWQQSVALVHNASGRFEDRWVRVGFSAGGPCVWTAGVGALCLPVRHGEGRLVAAPAELARIEAAGLAPARYLAGAGDDSAGDDSAGDSKPPAFAELAYPDNPNGSQLDIAGLCDPSGRVFGMMPHPEAFLHRFHHPNWRSADPRPADALQLFRNAVREAASSR